MKTPITDAAYNDASRLNPNSALMKLALASRRLELDRAALMEALEAVLKYSTPTASARIDATRTLAAARANFP